ncbi:MAG TPA: secretin N-terminal domain-containing protein [Azonexus sp.]|nr:secretin N-terminal domain-containing protein [Azonexus sp.]
MKYGLLSATLLSLLLAACQAPTPQQPLAGHLSTETSLPQAKGEIPAPVQQTLALPKPRAVPKAETYSVTVHNVPVADLLFALARDAKVNVDIHPGITGNVSLNAFNQTLQQLLNRIAKQVDMRFELDGPNLVVMPDSPFLKHYKVDYVNMARTVTETISTSTQINTNPGASGGASSGSTGNIGGGGGNISNTRIENKSNNQFWESLEKNIKDILQEEDKVLWERSCAEDQVGRRSANATGGITASGATETTPGPTTSSRGNITASGQGTQNAESSGSRQSACGKYKEAASVIVNVESGIITARATSRQHARVQEFIDRVIVSSRRQVLIEATIVEVTLGDGYQQGIQWDRLRKDGSTKFSLTPASVNSNVGNAVSPFTLTFSQLGSAFDITAIVDLLQSYGTAKVLSSPRLSVMNNQTALLKVVENFVYFNVKADTTSTANVGTTVAVTTTPQSVSVGLVMSVTAQVSDGEAVILNVRPTISSISELKEDPNPSIPAGVKNYVPQIRTREIESVMRVNSGEIAVLGGLMEDGVNWKTGRVPLLGQIPLVGELFTTRNNAATKSELVIFLRPVIIKDPSLNGDFASMRSMLPGENFFAQPPEAQPFNFSPPSR